MDPSRTSPGPGLPENAYRPLAPGERYEPLVAAAESPREMTPFALALGVGMTVLFSAAAAFIALKLGQGIETAIPIAILAVGVSAALKRSGALLQNLQVVTLGATAGIVVSGSVFVMPAIFVLGLADRSSVWQVFLVPFFGAVLGALFLVPFRHYFVADMHGRLPFPEGTATTEILVTGEKGGRAAGVLAASMGIGLLFDYLCLAFGAWRDVFTTALVPALDTFTNRFKAVFTFNTSAAVLGLGYITGLQYSAIICAGSFLSTFVFVPLFAHIGTVTNAGLFPGLPALGGLDAEGIFRNYARPIGIGGIFTAGLISIARMSPVIVQALRQVLGQLGGGAGARHAAAAPRTERDISMGTVAGLTLVTSIALGLYFRFVVLAGMEGATSKALVALVLTLAVSFLFAAVSAWAVAMISTSPISGMTLTALILSAALLTRLGLKGEQGMLALLLIGGVVCTALSMTGSMVTLMKIGYWVGGTPRRIQWSLIGGSALASLTVSGVLFLFASTNGYVASPEHPNPMLAPQANAMAAVVRSVMGEAGAPWFLYGLGAVIAVIVQMVGVSGLAFALGMYLPLELNAPLLGGAIVGWLVQRSAHGDARLEKLRGDRATLVASGLIAGGALAGVLQAATGMLEKKAGWSLQLGNDGAAGNWIGLAVFLVMGAGTWLDARRVKAG